MVSRRDFLKGSLATLLLLMSSKTSSSENIIQTKKEMFNGVTFSSWSPYGYYSLKDQLARTSKFSNSVVFTPAYYLKDIGSEELFARPEKTPTLDSLEYILKSAKELGFKHIGLKPHINVVKKGQWRGQIKGSKKFFKSYRNMLEMYLELIEPMGLDLFCIGTELDGTLNLASEWKSIISLVRKKLPGAELFYAPNWGKEHKVRFWDRLDYISSDFYYPTYGPVVVENIMAQLSFAKYKLKLLSKKYGKPLLLSEYGLASVEGANRKPWAKGKTLSYKEQYNRYSAIYNLFWDEPWVKGGFVWIYAPLFEQSNYKLDFTPYNKPAEKLMAKVYRSH